ncbi:hypothetical protein QQZ08_000874 [Neonectria magnoliae]|uniref:Uncharacterized protein n=1 Tax=Neonectria magnoliae TaxID=2732573 RepID=A0ABR1II64_9HYPO
MKLTYAPLIISLLSYSSLAASVDMWSSPLLSTRAAVPRNEPIDPEELKARLGTTPDEYKPDERHAGMVYFCRDENWGPPCFTYYPDLEYTCSDLGPDLAGHVGSVFVEPGAICRMSGLSSDDRCAPTKIFAWPETQSGWSDLLHEQTPGGEGILGYDTTHFTCAKCTNCIRE